MGLHEQTSGWQVQYGRVYDVVGTRAQTRLVRGVVQNDTYTYILVVAASTKFMISQEYVGPVRIL